VGVQFLHNQGARRCRPNKVVIQAPWRGSWPWYCNTFLAYPLSAVNTRERHSNVAKSSTRTKRLVERDPTPCLYAATNLERGNCWLLRGFYIYCVINEHVGRYAIPRRFAHKSLHILQLQLCLNQWHWIGGAQQVRVFPLINSVPSQHLRQVHTPFSNCHLALDSSIYPNDPLPAHPFRFWYSASSFCR